ncbi:MAG: methionyl-tRNA formyltransferase [Acidovorax sp.]|jgi:methionyl-tRNA formyltransferase|nr:methionyl-tRNA formyltransferase [Acidovorax sp.]
MKVIFAGTPEFARVAMERLLQAGFEIPLVLTQPDRPAGRGMKLQASPVKQCALEHGIRVIQPRSLRQDGKYPEDAAQARQALLEAGADVMVVAAYGLILPQWVLDLPPKGCLNIHASILPRWRGAAPIHRAIEAGDVETGVTIMQMDIGLDTGDMCLLERLPIEATDTTASLQDKLAALGGRLIVEALEMAACGGLPRTPQPAEGVNYAHKIEKAESAMDWCLDAKVLDRRLRAFNPFPGGSTQLGEETIKLWAATPEALPAAADGAAQPGPVLAADADGVLVACGQGALRLTQLQRAGGKKLAAGDFLRGFEIPVGAMLQLPEQP